MILSRKRGFLVLMFLLCLGLSFCTTDRTVRERLDHADSLIESHPDSAWFILKEITESSLKSKRDKARYALLMSMALDKNYIDTTNFNVLQPAIDYYLKKGTPDEKLRTYYYQGRIYQNQGDLDNAIFSFKKAVETIPESTDLKVAARSLVSQGILFHSFYDFHGYINNYTEAAKIYKTINDEYHEFDCLLNLLNGYTILNDKEHSDSIANLIKLHNNLDDYQKKEKNYYLLSYTTNFNLQEESRELVENYHSELLSTVNGMLSLAYAYSELGENNKALEILNQIFQLKLPYDTLKYKSIMVSLKENIGEFKEALSSYKDFSNSLYYSNVKKFDQKSKSIEEKYQLELQAQKDAIKKSRIIWGCIAGIVFLLLGITILMLLFLRNRDQKKLAYQEVRNKQLENENLYHRVYELEEESESLKRLLENRSHLPEEVQDAIKVRIEMLNSLLAGYVSENEKYEKPYEKWVKELTENTEEFMNSNRMAFQASHPGFIGYFEEHGLTKEEINYVCLYALGLKGKEVGNYIKRPSHVNMSSGIRKKLGIDKHETNIGIYVRTLLKNY